MPNSKYICLEYHSLLFSAKVVLLRCPVPCPHTLSIVISLWLNVSMLIQHRSWPPVLSAIGSTLSFHVLKCYGCSLKGTSDAAIGAVRIIPVTPKMPKHVICQAQSYCFVFYLQASHCGRTGGYGSYYQCIAHILFSIHSSVFLFVPLQVQRSLYTISMCLSNNFSHASPKLILYMSFLHVTILLYWRRWFCNISCIFFFFFISMAPC